MEMKFITALMIFASLSVAWAQEKQPVQRRIVSIEEKDNTTKVAIPGITIEVDDISDTIAKISMGQKRYDIVEGNDRTYISEVRIPQKRFKGHYSGITMGFNWYVDPDFKTSFAPEQDFMDLNIGKSVSFGINPLQYSIGLQKEKNTIGLVLGAGWSVHNYRFNNNYQLVKDNNGLTNGIKLENELSKNKLTISYINIPLMLEFQIPLNNQENRLIFDVGGYCGFKIGSHTKMVDAQSGDKKKSRPDLNLNPIQYGTIFQFGYKQVKLFGTYNFSTLFNKDKGPELYPVQIGVALSTF